MLIKATKWIKETFEDGSRPRKSTVIRWIEQEQVPGRIIDGEPYVDADRFALGGTGKKTISGIDLVAC